MRSVTGRRMLVLTDGVLPLIDLARGARLRAGARRSASSSSPAAPSGGWRSSSSALVGQRELVTRPLPAEAGSQSCLSGGAVLSDGTISLIVDCDALAEAGGAARGGTASSDLANAA